MKVNLFAGDETATYVGVAFDRQGRETDVTVKADSLDEAKDRVSDSMADYNWTDVQGLKRTRAAA